MLPTLVLHLTQDRDLSNFGRSITQLFQIIWANFWCILDVLDIRASDSTDGLPQEVIVVRSQKGDLIEDRSGGILCNGPEIRRHVKRLLHASRVS